MFAFIDYSSPAISAPAKIEIGGITADAVILGTFFTGSRDIPIIGVGVIGSQVMADIAAGLTRYSDLPDGWEYLGAGISRAVFKGPDGVAYKVLTGNYYNQANESEYRNFITGSESCRIMSSSRRAISGRPRSTQWNLSRSSAAGNGR